MRKIIMRTIIVAAVLSGVMIILLSGCETATNSSTDYTIVIKDSSDKRIAIGNLELTRDFASRNEFEGFCKFFVDVPEKPSSQQDYAIRCLSTKQHIYTATLKDGQVIISLEPIVKDADIYLAGEVGRQSIKGKCIYQSYAGEYQFGTFEMTPAGRQ
jgi:hypothetical protein